MRRRKSFSFGAKYLIAGAFAAGAFAATAIDVRADGKAGRAPPVAQATNWSGFYFGVHSGWGWADINSQFTNAAGVPTGASDSVQHDAQVVGGQIGIQHQFGHVVLGVEASLSSAFQDGFANVTCPNATRTCGKRFDDVFMIGPRLGWAMGKWMPYLTGGYANVSIEHESFLTGAGTNVFLGRERFDGWFIGGGVDMALAHGWTVGLEYKHMEFDSQAFQTFSPAGVLSGDNRVVDPTIDTLTLRVSWKLGRTEPPRPLK
jgi:outer membrane immunogenic protein